MGEIDIGEYVSCSSVILISMFTGTSATLLSLNCDMRITVRLYTALLCESSRDERMRHRRALQGLYQYLCEHPHVIPPYSRTT